MKIARFQVGGRIAFGELEGSIEDGDAELIEFENDPLLSKPCLTGRRFPFRSVRLLAPIASISKVVCVGNNFPKTGTEAKSNDNSVEPLLFLEPSSAVIGPQEAIVRPAESTLVEHEGELGVVIGRQAKNVPYEHALDYVYGYTCANDVTARDLQRIDGQWMRSKSFDTFLPLGPVIETELDPWKLRLVTRLNGVVAQDAMIADLISSVPRIVSYASTVFTLHPGDVIIVGAAQVGPIVRGDVVEVEIEGIGTLCNTVL